MQMEEDSDAEENYVISADDIVPRVTVESRYKDKGESKQILMGMCFGLTNNKDKRKIGDLSLEPYASASHKKEFTPSVKQLRVEIVRRSEALMVKAPRSSHYTKDRCYKWLMHHPIVHQLDIAFLVEEEAKYKTKLEAAANEVKAKKTSNWVDNDPYLRLYHCLIDDTVKAAFLERDNVLNREELDARKSDKRPKTFEQEAAELFNDATFAPRSLHLPSLHSEFNQTKILRLEDMPGVITPEEVKLRMADSRSKLMAVISNWELSGNGFGQRAQDDEGFGHLEEEHFLDDNRQAFIQGYRSHILYLWHLSDEEDILHSVKSALDPDCAANTDYVAEVKAGSRKRKTEEEDKQFKEDMSASFHRISFSHLYNQITQTQKSKADFEVKYILADDLDVKEVYKRMMVSAEETIKELKAQLRETHNR
jgi:DNA-directed RNA polymerase subunit L